MISIESKIRKRVVQALSKYRMIEEGDKILVAVSGGVDSSVMLLTLIEIQKRAPFGFSLQPFLVDHEFPNVSYDIFKKWIGSIGHKLIIEKFDTYSLFGKENLQNRSPCQLCSRLRRGILYSFARKNEFSKIALGHNRDDLNETVLLNMFYTGKLAGMPPKLLAEDGINQIIRPMCLIAKEQIIKSCKNQNIPIVRNTFCEQIPNNARYRIRQLLSDLQQDNPKIKANLLASLGNIVPSTLMDNRLWNHTNEI